MPYYVHPRDRQPIPDSDAAFSTRETAHANCVEADHKVTYVETREETDEWHAREQHRFYSFTYQPTPWATHYRFTFYDASRVAITGCHFAHLSHKSPGLIAYTPSAEHGYQDRQVTVRPGKYLAQFYGDVPLTLREQWIAACTPIVPTFQLARTADECERVYRGKEYVYVYDTYPFVSCMGPQGHTGFAVWPTRVYGDSDLAVAYTGPLDACTARAIVWPDKRLYGRLYGNVGPLRRALEAAGYENGWQTEGDYSPLFHGARIRAIDYRNGYLMPYLDIARGVIGPRNGFFTLVSKYPGRFDYNGTETDGYVGVDEDCDDSDDDDTPTCEHCERRPVMADSDYCRVCEDARQYCEGCHSDTWEDMVRAVSLDTFGYLDRRIEEYRCTRCRDNHPESTCAVCEADWQEWDLDEQLQIARIDAHLTNVCVKCAESHLACHVCRTPHPIDGVCPEGCTPRCTATLTLPLETPEVPL